MTDWVEDKWPKRFIMISKSCDKVKTSITCTRDNHLPCIAPSCSYQSARSHTRRLCGGRLKSKEGRDCKASHQSLHQRLPPRNSRCLQRIRTLSFGRVAAVTSRSQRPKLQLRRLSPLRRPACQTFTATKTKRREKIINRGSEGLIIRGFHSLHK